MGFEPVLAGSHRNLEGYTAMIGILHFFNDQSGEFVELFRAAH